jgi:large subunit ribosomal protein L6
MNTKLNKIIKILPEISLRFLTLHNNNFVVIITKTGKKKYLSIPKHVDLIKKDGCLIINSLTNEKNFTVFNRFCALLNSWTKRFDKSIKKKLILKGLGFKISMDDNNNLELKLGYSHIIKLPIPEDDIVVKIEKNAITIEGFDSIQVGNFTTKIRNLRVPDSYKGKGFWYKNESIILKEVKKT